MVDERARLNRLCELNVLRQVENVAANPFVLDAWAAGAELSVHGWCYSLANGLVTDLGACSRAASRRFAPAECPPSVFS